MERNTAIVKFFKTAEINYIVTNDKVGVFLRGKGLNLALTQGKAINQIVANASQQVNWKVLGKWPECRKFSLRTILITNCSGRILRPHGPEASRYEYFVICPETQEVCFRQ